MAAGGLISFDEAGTKRVTDTRTDEKERGITIKSTGVALQIEYGEENPKLYNINLVDTPGHIDFSSEVTAAIRITDGAVVLVDSVEGVSAQTETVLRQALAERLQPVLVINKIDRYFTELKLNGDEAYEKLRSIIARVNDMIELYQPENPTVLDPQVGNVIFSCARYNWGFSIKTFAELYAKKAGKSPAQYMGILWGDTFFNPETKKISKSSAGGVRGFAHFIYEPLKNAINAMQNNTSNMVEVLEQAFIVLTNEEKKYIGDDQFSRRVLRRAFPLAPVVVDCIIKFLPPPYEAQRRKVDVLYTGPYDSSTYKGIQMCDPDAPLVIYISKMVPTGTGGTFYAFGRIFSGTVSMGQKVSILGANYEHGDGKKDCFDNKSIQRVIRLIGAKTESVDEMKCGNTVALVGVSEYLLKSGTVTTCPDKYPIRTMKFSVSPVVRVAVSPKNMAEVGKFKEGMIRLSKSDPCLKVELVDTGDFVIGGAGKLHLEIAINDLREFLNGMEIIVSEPVVPYKETVSKLSEVCLSKSPNKHNRLYCTAEPLSEELTQDLESGEYSTKDLQKLGRRLIDVHGWDKGLVGKIWAINDGNILVDGTKGIDYLNEIKDACVSAFNWYVGSGVLCEEQVRGVKFQFVDVKLHADTIHRGSGQILPTARRVYSAAFLLAGPKLMEPVYSINVQVDD
ncbi:MAG: GTP-binding protein, partial [Proteobacteria bacterium]|nr:GTP-binding protein [Pseudomonadota bacterium]